jgi:hypothetical protein
VELWRKGNFASAGKVPKTLDLRDEKELKVKLRADKRR